jgi:putative ABC transport system permease protein
MIETWLQDTKVAVRSLLVRSPGFTAVAAITLALGVAADTTVFSVMDGLLLRPLPYPSSDELVAVAEVTEQGNEASVAGPNFLDWRAGNRSFEHLVARTNPTFGAPTIVLGGDEPVRVPWAAVSEGFFQMMEVAPAIGRVFQQDDYQAASSPVAVVSYSFWDQSLGRATDLAARTIRLPDGVFSVIGVMPPGFDFPDDSQLWLPLVVDSTDARDSHNWLVTGRLRDGVTVSEAQADLDGITARLRAELGTEMEAVATAVRPLQEQMYGSMRGPLTLLLAASAFVLLVGCVNLASTLLARGRQRESEMAVRAALGAGQGRIVRQLVTENAVLALLGTALGVALAFPATELIVRAGPPALSDRVELDLRVLIVTSAVSAATILLFGLFPALVGARGNLVSRLREGGRGGGARGGRAWNALVAGEVALTVVLLAASAVLVRSFARVLAVDPGFEPSGVLTADLPFPAYEAGAGLAQAQSAVLDAVASVPGVREAALVNHLPLSGIAFNGDFEREDGREVDGSVDYRVASADYFDVMRIPVLQGRAFAAQDDMTTEDAAVVSRSMAERHWPGESPVGRRIRNLANDSWIYPDRWITIVGVVGDVRHRALTQEPRPTVYVHNLQRPARAASSVLVIRAQDGAVLSPADLRARIQSVEPRMPLDFTDMETRVSASTTTMRFPLLVITAFALAALALAAAGVYGVVSYAVARRTREMGIRIALGAGSGRVLQDVVGSSLRTVVIGAVLGWAGALLAGRLLAGMVFEVRPADPLSVAGAVALLIAVATIASLVPALRATRVDPLTTMRAE